MYYTQLKKEFGSVTSLPYFPPKKLFPLSSDQVDERRIELERFIQYGRHTSSGFVLSTSRHL